MHYKNSEIDGQPPAPLYREHSFFIPNTKRLIKVTVSIGVASYLGAQAASVRSSSSSPIGALLRQADAATRSSAIASNQLMMGILARELNPMKIQPG